MALQQALAASNDPGDTKNFIHEPEDEPTPFATALRKMQRAQSCHPTVTEQMTEWMANTTLAEFCEEKTSDHYLDLSGRVIRGLGYVHDDLTLAMDHNVLSMVWEMHDHLPEGINLCAALDQLYIRFCYNKTKSYKESDAVQNEFLSVLLHVVDRVPAKEGEESLQQLLRINPTGDGKSLSADAKDLWLETEQVLRDQKDLIDSLDIDQTEKDKMNLVMPPASTDDDVGPSMDKGVYEMIVAKQKGFREGQSNARRNELKDRIVKLGQFCLIVHNNIQQPHGKYSALEVHFRRMFSNIKYSVADMMSQLTDQEDLTEV